MRATVLIALFALLLGGCTDDGGSDSESKPGSGSSSGQSGEGQDEQEEPQLEGPECTEIWRIGETLPEEFECTVEGRQAVMDVVDCDDGSKLVVADNLLWGRTGEEIYKPDVSPLQDTPEYGKAYSDCTGE